jgi:hypothetical protein
LLELLHYPHWLLLPAVAVVGLLLLLLLAVTTSLFVGPSCLFYHHCFAICLLLAAVN